MNQVIIEKQKLQHNIDIVKDRINKYEYPNGKKPIIIAVLKGNGYGMGIELLANQLIDKNINFFAVSEVEEAKSLRMSGFTNKILVLNSTGIDSEIEEIIKLDLIATIGSKTVAIKLNDIAKKNEKIVQAHIKIDTGFGRFGFVYNSKLADELIDLFSDLSSIKITGIYSHFSRSFEHSKKATEKQFIKFNSVISALKDKKFDTGIVHICNSPAFLRYPQMHLDAVRIGSVFTGRVQTEGSFGLQKVGYLESTISDIKTLPKNYRIGYGNTCKLNKETKVAIVEAGYAEGIGIRGSRDTYRLIDRIRFLKDDMLKLFSKQRLYIEVSGKKCPVLGRIAMKNIVIDISGVDADIDSKVKININMLFVDSSIKRLEL
jgi:alanine racemase